ncbi:hypothetical protein FACS1894211_13880 [Clostridia bacterium]|nr:hypothetical protein FACS1894211_13880 [Clostridia bacterium]
MKIKRIILFLICIAVMTAVLTACKKPGPSDPSDPGDNGTPQEQLVPKTAYGVDYLFPEYEGFYAAAPNIIEDGAARYVVYNTNKTKNSSDAVLAARKAVLQSGKWVYGEQSIILEPSAGKWDSARVLNADIVEGKFTYSGTEYKYLMAYQGNGITAEKRFKIGLAFSNDILGNWVKTDAPFIDYDYESEGDAYGAGQPSLLSINRQGQIMLFYAHGSSLLTSTRFVEADLSDFSVPLVSGYVTVPFAGWPVDGNPLPMINNADFGYDPVSGYVVAVKDGFPYAGTNPATATKVEIAKILLDDLFETDGAWRTVVPVINDLDLATQGNTGWKRVHSACMVTNSFGELSAEALEIGFTSGKAATDPSDESWKFYDGVHAFAVPDALRED